MTHKLNDERDPCRHGGPNAHASMFDRFRRWWFLQERDTQSRYCIHTSYVGKDGAISFCCPLCCELGFSPFTERSVFVQHDWYEKSAAKKNEKWT